MNALPRSQQRIRRSSILLSYRRNFPATRRVSTPQNNAGSRTLRRFYTAQNSNDEVNLS